jgi:putative cell wall-binding protein/Tol biopolymer transport system component
MNINRPEDLEPGQSPLENKMLRQALSLCTAVLCALLVGSIAVSSDRAIGAPGPSQTELVSVANSAVPIEGNRDSQESSVSGDGRFVAFSSLASNLTTTPNDSRKQIYLRDLATGTTRMVSVTSAGAAGDGHSMAPSISSDGAHIAYLSLASNLAPGASGSLTEALLWSRDTGDTRLVSVSNEPVPVAANRGLFSLELSADGTAVVFVTNATNLTAESVGTFNQVFKRDLVANTTSLVSRDPVAPGAGASADATDASVSSDGRYVSFESTAQLTSTPTWGHRQVYVHDSQSGATQLVSLSDSGASAGNGDSQESSISANGRVVAFTSRATDLSGSPAAAIDAIYVRELDTGTTSLVSLDHAGNRNVNGVSRGAAISADGKSVAFHSRADDVVAEGGAPVGVSQVYVRDLVAHRTVLASRPQSGIGAGSGDSVAAELSADGTTVAFSSVAENLVPAASTGSSQVFVRNVTERARIERMSGADRFEASSAISAGTFAPGVKVAYVASGAVYSDALSGSAAVGLLHGPILLVTKDAIPASIAAELDRLDPQIIVVLGGPASVSVEVESQLRAFAANHVFRYSGADRFEVSARISSLVFSAHAPVAYIASGATFPDALSASAAAGREQGPVLLVTKNDVPSAIATELARLAPMRIIVVGGADTISDTVVTTLRATAPVTRVSGADRFAVSAAVSASTFPSGAHTVFVASGATFPDALSGSAAAIQNGGPVLLVTAGDIPAAVSVELDRLNPTRIVVLGGPNTISETVYNALQAYL